jgi:hypothetical protein
MRAGIPLIWKAIAAGGVVLAAVAIFVAVVLNVKLEDEGANRRDQSCELFESAHLADVEGLRRTYGYLVELTPEQAAEPINRLLIRLLPEAEREARKDRAPEYCDEPRIGLPEPDPVVPERPAALRKT